MNLNLGVLAVGVLLLVALTAPASAQDEPRRFNLTANIGFLSAAGNNDLTTLSGDEKLDFTTIDSLWKFSQGASAVYGRTDDSTTASAYRLNGRVDRSLTSRLAAFVGIGWERNRFAGIARRFEEILGAAYQVLQLSKDELRVEGGAAFNQQQNVAGLDDNFVAARGAATYKHLFTKQAYFQQLAEFLSNLENGQDLRINTESALVAPLSNKVAVKLSYVVMYDRLPEPGFETTDRVFTSGIQVTF